MAAINQTLIKRLQEHLGVRPNAVYTRISKTGRERRVARRDLAALLLAWELGLNIHKYATAEQLDRLGGVTGGSNGRAQPPAPRWVARAPNRKGKRNRARKTKGNSVFVVHGRDQALRKSMFEFLRTVIVQVGKVRPLSPASIW